VLITNAQIDDIRGAGSRRADVRVGGRTITDLGAALERGANEEAYDAGGAALLPGLHDHHLHLFAIAAALDSLPCGPPTVTTLDELATALRSVPGEHAIRGVGYHESVAGELDRTMLDRLVADRPVRIQHRGGAVWMLNTKALEIAGIRPGDPGVELDEDQTLTGRLWRGDHLIRTTATELPDLGAASRRLVDYGITGVTDATPDLDAAAGAHLANQATSGALAQRVLALGLDTSRGARVTAGPRKFLLADHALPTLEDLAERIAGTHAQGRAVAIHCVTRHATVLTIAALEIAGPRAGDRIEHGAIIPTELRSSLADNGVAVVTQPSFVRDRGDDYLRDVDPGDVGELYPYRSLLDCGIEVAPSSDAPFGDLDPWRSIQAAAQRRTERGRDLGHSERLSPRAVLDGYLSPLTRPGGPPRRIEVGAAADLCLLNVPLEEALARPNKDNVRLAVIDGTVTVR